MDDQHDLFFDATDAKRKPGLGSVSNLPQPGAPLCGGRAAARQRSRHQIKTWPWTRAAFPLADSRGLWNVLLTYEKSPDNLLAGLDSVSARHRFIRANSPATDTQNCSAAEQCVACHGYPRIQAGAAPAGGRSLTQQCGGSRTASAR